MPARSSEDELIARYFAPLAGEGGLALSDDAALLRPHAGHDLVLTVDAIVAGVHFLADDPPAAIAAKALGVNLSDLAAKGAAPLGFLLALALPDDWTEAWLAAFSAGLGEVSRQARCPLLGGDTVRAAGPLSLTVTAIGEVLQGRMVLRASARPGDAICVSGTIGDAALGLKLLRNRPAWADVLSATERDFLIERYRRPQPRLALATVLRDHASAAMDVSDGLAGDLAKMMRAGLTAEVDLEAIPLSTAARACLAADPHLIDLVAIGGDDYEILCTVPAADMPAFADAARKTGIAVTRIGVVEDGAGPPRFRAADGAKTYARASFSHF